MAGKTLRFGMVGAGYMSKLHCLAIRNLQSMSGNQTPPIEMNRVADVSADAARASAEIWGWKHASADWRDVTRADDVDVVVVLTPNDSHAEITLDAFAHGKHVLCEKPIAHTIEAARTMVDAHAASGLKGMINYSYRNWPAIQQAKVLIDEGRLGDIQFVSGTFFQDYAKDPSMPHTWRHRRASAGSGALGDIGSHIIDIACHLAGPIAQVSSRMVTQMPTRPGRDGSPQPVDVDDMTVILAQFANGATGTISCGWALSGHKQNMSFSIVGTRGAVEFDWRHFGELHFFEDTGEATTQGFRRIVIGGMHPQNDIYHPGEGQGIGYTESFFITLRRFVNSIASGQDTTPSFREALHVAEVVDATIGSAGGKGWVAVPAH